VTGEEGLNGGFVDPSVGMKSNTKPGASSSRYRIGGLFME